MIVKDEFTLLKGIPNILNLSSSAITASRLKGGKVKVRTVLKLMGRRIEHFSKDKVYNVIKSDTAFDIVRIPKYPLALSYNKPTKNVIFNLNYFGTTDITETNPNPRDIYAALAYGYCFSELVKTKPISDRYAGVFASYLLSVFVRIFGKEYGLLGYYSTSIPKLKFILTCYCLSAFFGYKNDEGMYRKASSGLAYNFKEDMIVLRQIDFSNIDGLINALSKLQVMPGITRFNFTAKLIRFLTIDFIPAIEDCSRFVSFIMASGIPGITFIPAFIMRYNEQEYIKIIQLSKSVF